LLRISVGDPAVNLVTEFIYMFAVISRSPFMDGWTLMSVLSASTVPEETHVS
jgi:hypothetical protein